LQNICSASVTEKTRIILSFCSVAFTASKAAFVSRACKRILAVSIKTGIVIWLTESSCPVFPDVWSATLSFLHLAGDVSYFVTFFPPFLYAADTIDSLQ